MSNVDALVTRISNVSTRASSQLPNSPDRYVRKLKASDFWLPEALTHQREHPSIAKYLSALRNIFSPEREQRHPAFCSESTWHAAVLHFGHGYLHHEIGRKLGIASQQSCTDCYRTIPPALLKNAYVDYFVELSQGQKPNKNDLIAALKILHIESATRAVTPWVRVFEAWIVNKGPKPDPIDFDLTTSPCLPSIYLLGALRLPFMRMASDETLDYLPKGTIYPVRLKEGICAVELRDHCGKVKDLFAITDIHGTRLTFNENWFRRARGAAGYFTMAVMGQGPFSITQAFSPRKNTRSHSKTSQSLRSYAYVFGELLKWKAADRIVQIPSSFKGESISPSIPLRHFVAGTTASRIILTDPITMKPAALYTIEAANENTLKLSSPYYVGDFARWSAARGIRSRDAAQARRWMEGDQKVSIPRLEPIELYSMVRASPGVPARTFKWLYFLQLKLNVSHYSGGTLLPRCVFDLNTRRRMIAFYPEATTQCEYPVAALYSELVKSDHGSGSYVSRLLPRGDLAMVRLIYGDDAH
jgi:hypothetical protein